MKASLFRLDSYAAFGGLAIRTVEQVVIANALGPAGHGTYSSAKTASILASAVPWGSGVAASDRAHTGREAVSRDPVKLSSGFIVGLAAVGGVTSIPLLLSLNFFGGLNLHWIDFLLLFAGACMQGVAMVSRRVTAINAGSLAPNIVQAIALAFGLLVVGTASLAGELSVTVALAGYVTFLCVEVALHHRRAHHLNDVAKTATVVAFRELAGSFTFSQMLHMAVNRADILTLTIVLGPRSAGLYAVALAYVQPVQQYGSLLALRDAASLKSSTGWSLAKPRLDCVVLSIASAGLALTTIPFVFGEEFAEARLPAVLLAFVSLLQVSQGRLMHLSYSRGKHTDVDRAELLGLVLLVGLTAAFAPLFGINGAVLASFVAYGSRSARLLKRVNAT